MWTAIAVVGDVLMVVCGLFLGFWIRFRSGWISLKETFWTTAASSDGVQIQEYRILFILGAILLLATFGYLKLYDTRHLLRKHAAWRIIAKGSTFWLFLYLGLSLALKLDASISRIYVLCSYASCLLLLYCWRSIFHYWVSRDKTASNLRTRVVLLGWTGDTEKVLHAVRSDAGKAFELLGWISTPGSDSDTPSAHEIQRLGDISEVGSILSREDPDAILLADLSISHPQMVALANLCERELAGFWIVPTYFESLSSGLQVEHFGGVPVLGISSLPLDHLNNRVAKRCVDIVGSIVGLVGAIPVILVFGFIVWMESPGPIFYSQVRTGRNGRQFKIIKIRSMRLDAETDGGAQWAVKDDPRRLRVGAFMREWNIDEVPQFWNVLRGEMSLVGPRPERPELIEEFKYDIPHYNARLSCKPGITGWAQVNGYRGNTSLSERIRHDLYYLEHWSLVFDFQIMLRTFCRNRNAY